MQGIDRAPLEKAVRDFITQQLEYRLDDRPLIGTESLFRSGRLDSLAAVELLLFIEAQPGVLRKTKHIELRDIDSIEDILHFLGCGRSS